MNTMFHIRPMTAADLPLGLELSQEAGWNQLPADWERFLELQPDGCFVAEWDGVPIATTSTSIFGNVAWISMVLVRKTHRGRGIAKALMAHALSFLDSHEVSTVRLDATPLGQPVYERLGFVEQFKVARFEGVIPAGHDAAKAESALPPKWEALAELDHAITNTDRKRLLLRLFAEQPQNIRCVQGGDRVTGYMTARPGAKALMLGPCMGRQEAAKVLFADAWHVHAGQRVFIDVPVPNAAATAFVEAGGLKFQRHLTRMCRGILLCEQVASLWASSGPEKG
jgi:GNAT superfamily N-acetyltransferase